MAHAPYILARTLKDAHTFARNGLGLERGRYRIINTASTLKSVRGADLHLVPGWEKRFDRFAVKGALRWTRMNVIDHTKAEEPVEQPITDPEADAAADIVFLGSVPDDLDPPGEQLMIPVAADEAHTFITETSNGDNMIAEGGPVELEVETPKPKNRRRSRCKACGTLHYREDPCPTEDA